MAGETPAPKTYEIHYEDSVVWGAPFTSSKGIVKDVSRDPNPSTEPIDNNRGAVIGIIVYDKQESFSVQIEAKAGVAPPANCSWIKFQSAAADEGSAVELVCFVNKCGRAWTHRGKKTFRLDLTYYPHIRLPAATVSGADATTIVGEA